MAIIKCKMCGGDLILQEATGTAECAYCGTLQTVPTAQDEVLQNLFNRANLLRRRCEFDKAEHIYEKIVQTDPAQSEAYWGLVLCKFGIEYVEDPATLQRIPTCHRTNPDPIGTDEDYLAALEHGDISQKRIYAAEGREIDRLQKEILALSQQESPYDVFICYKETDESGKRTPDSVIANDIYHQLTQEGYKVFYAAITLEDKLGMAYEPCIFGALSTARIMLVIGTRPEFFSAVWVRNEWGRFLKMMKKDRSKLLIPCYKDMDAYELPEEFAHLQAQDMGKIGFMTDVLRGIRKLLTHQKEDAPAPQAAPAPQPASQGSAQLILDSDALYEGQVFAGIPHGFGKAQYANGDVYEGNWNRGQRSGQGKLTHSDQTRWEGLFKNDKPWTGTGTHYISVNNKMLRYEGELKEGLREGFGKFWLADAVHEGQWIQDKRNGPGKLIWNEGGEWIGEYRDNKMWEGRGVVYTESDDGISLRYEGEFKNGARNGFGTFRYTDSSYEGQWVNGKRHGQGKTIWDEGGEWIGEFRDGNRWTGSGVIYTESKDGASLRYEGEFRDGQRNGYGKQIYTDSVYEGQWVNGKENGQGKLFWNQGGQWFGEFRDGNRWNGEGIWYFEDSRHIGSTVNGKRQGQGKLIWNNGGFWEGQYRDDKRWNGHGTIYYNDSCYYGPLVNGMRNGQGRLVWDNGGSWEGTFKNGEPWNGKGTWYENGAPKNGLFMFGKYIL